MSTVGVAEILLLAGFSAARNLCGGLLTVLLSLGTVLEALILFEADDLWLRMKSEGDRGHIKPRFRSVASCVSTVGLPLGRGDRGLLPLLCGLGPPV